MPDTTLLADNLPTGWAVDCYIFDAAGRIWDGTAYVTYAAGDIAGYAVSAPETPADSGTYVAAMPPASPAGLYTWSFRKRLSDGPATTDPEVGYSAVPATWDGSEFPTAAGGGGDSVAAVLASNAILTQPLGTDKSYDLPPLADASGAVITTYDGSETLTCALWSGQDQAVLASPAAAWISPIAGTIRITISDTAIAGLAAGLYRLQGTLTSGATTIKFFDGAIDLTPAPGDAAEPATYCTFEDVKLYAPQIQKLQDTRAELAGFLAERGRARSYADEHCLDGYRPNYGRARRGLAADGLTAGSYLRWVTAGPLGEATPTLAVLRAAIALGGLTVTAKIREACAHLAAAIVFSNQPGKDNPYHQQGMYHQAIGAELLAEAVVEIDLTSPLDGVADVRIGQDCTWLS
jgi:hypothetical protein